MKIFQNNKYFYHQNVLKIENFEIEKNFKKKLRMF